MDKRGKVGSDTRGEAIAELPEKLRGMFSLPFYSGSFPMNKLPNSKGYLRTFFASGYLRHGNGLSTS